ncbi:MAG: 3-dehydroquinate synthase II family protein [Desertimonas sp.]
MSASGESAGLDRSVDDEESARHANVTDTISALSPSDRPAESAAHHLAWLDLRAVPDGQLAAIAQAAANHGIDAVVDADAARLSSVPPTLTRVLVVDGPLGEPSESVDVVLVNGPYVSVPRTVGVHIEVVDAPTLQDACGAVRTQPWTVLTFADPTKIPLEIVIAAAENAGGRTVTVANDLGDAEIILGVLEHGSDGVLLAPRRVDDVVALAELCRRRMPELALCELTVETIDHVGMGERACIDTCSLLGTDEGILVGSFATALVLSCSETHPLPYMPTRPFRVNAGAVHSYVLGPHNRTSYLSELRAGHRVLAVTTTGTAREVTVGRVKIERRPLLGVQARGPEGEECNLIVQDDWHVRLLGPGGRVRNVTELKKGDQLLGHAPRDRRHVGLPISELCVER